MNLRWDQWLAIGVIAFMILGTVFCVAYGIATERAARHRGR
jgi:cell division protein FtsX